MAKANKTVSMQIEVAERLEQEDNQSEIVELALREHFGMEEDN